MAEKRSQSKRRYLSILLTITVSGVLLYLAFRGVDWDEMLATLRQGDFGALLFGCFLLTISLVLRALRWRVLLSANRPVTPLTAFWGINAGYLGNAFLPARAGEVLRSALISKHTGINVGYVLATAFTERILDAAVLITIGVAALSTLPDTPDWFLRSLYVMAVVGIAGIGFMLIAPRFEKQITNLVMRIPLPVRLRELGLQLLQQFLLGMKAFQNTRRLFHFMALTAMIWTMDAIFGLQIASAFDINVTFVQMLLLLSALGLSSAVPSTPGYVGVYQFVAVAVLTQFDVTQDQALVLILAYQAISYVMFTLYGGLGIWKLNITPTAESQGEAAVTPQ